MSLDWGNIVRSPIIWIVIGLALLAGAFWLGTIKSREWADSEYLQERAERDQRLAVLAAENDALKKENELKAEILKQVDAANDVKKAEEFTRLQDEREKKENEIQNADPVTSLSGLCDDAERAGFELSFCR